MDFLGTNKATGVLPEEHPANHPKEEEADSAGKKLKPEEESGPFAKYFRQKLVKQEPIIEEIIQLCNPISGSAPKSAVIPNGSASPCQLTIFYSGTVSIYEGVSPEKAQAIMLIAAAASANNNNVKNAEIGLTASPLLTRSPSLQSTSAVASPQLQMLASQNKPISKLQAELPIARRQSLQRFLEKRRDRLVSKAPYPLTKAADSK